jgi:hypothetical protein
MTQLIDPSDPAYFKQTCDKPYDRHNYKLFYTNGDIKDFDNYEDAQLTWFQTPNQFLSHIEVIDKKKKKNNKKGFS